MNDISAFIKRPRLYVDAELRPGGAVDFPPEQAHYLRSVLRQKPGDVVRVFNRRDGEYGCTLAEVGKKEVQGTADILLRPAEAPPRALHLFFAPIKKARMDMLVEKAVELGATHFHPVLTQNCEVRQINAERLTAQITEATEQCERLDRPALLPLVKLAEIEPGAIRLFACIERAEDAPPLRHEAAGASGPCGVLIGPEGGFTAAEIERLRAHPHITPVTLGPRTLRAETAALAALLMLQD